MYLLLLVDTDEIGDNLKLIIAFNNFKKNRYGEWFIFKYLL